MTKAVATTEVADPHDTFLRQLLSEPAVAADFVQNYLPVEVVVLLDLSQLRIEKETFVDARLRKHFSDILYSVPLKTNLPVAVTDSEESTKQATKPRKKGKGKAEPPAEARVYLYLLFEHKSQPDKGVRLQLLRYMTRIWEKEWKRRKQLSPIIPLVFYHGLEPWNYSHEFADLLDLPTALKPYTPHFRHLLTDLSIYPDEQIRGEVWLRVNLLLLKHIFDADLGRQLPRILGLMRALARQESGLEMLQTLLTYVAEASNMVSETEFYQGVMAAVTPERSELVESLAQKWIDQGIDIGKKEGIDIGKKEGKLEAQRQTLLRLLQWRFALTDEALTEYNGRFAKIQQIESLLHLLDRLLAGITLAEFDLQVQRFQEIIL